MNLSDEGLMQLYDNFPLLQEILAQRSINRFEFYALSTLRTSHLNREVHKVLMWICEQVTFEPPQEVLLSPFTEAESTSKF